MTSPGRTTLSTLEAPNPSNSVEPSSQRHHSRPGPVVETGGGVFHRAILGKYPRIHTSSRTELPFASTRNATMSNDHPDALIRLSSTMSTSPKIQSGPPECTITPIAPLLRALLSFPARRYGIAKPCQPSETAKRGNRLLEERTRATTQYELFSAFPFPASVPATMRAYASGKEKRGLLRTETEFARKSPFGRSSPLASCFTRWKPMHLEEGSKRIFLAGSPGKFRCGPTNSSLKTNRRTSILLNSIFLIYDNYAYYTIFTIALIDTDGISSRRVIMLILALLILVNRSSSVSDVTCLLEERFVELLLTFVYGTAARGVLEVLLCMNGFLPTGRDMV